MAAIFLPLFWTLFRGYEKACLICWQAYFLRGAPRLTEACPRPGLGRKTYWHEDKARLTGTRIYIILLLESHGIGDGVAVGNCGAL